MNSFTINKKCTLKGTVQASKAKNATLPLIAAALLTEEDVIINEAPQLLDVRAMCNIAAKMGARIIISDKRIIINAAHISTGEAVYEDCIQTRASILVLGSVLSRLGKAKIAMPGGCSIGNRPIDLHLKGFSQMGADINTKHGNVLAKTKKLTGAEIYLDFPSVGATENILLGAVTADGVTVIRNASAEPEVVDLENMLTSMGAKIIGIGTDTLCIEGTDHLHGTEYTPIPDRMEAGTFMAAAAATCGEVTVDGVICSHLSPVTAKLKESGVTVIENKNSITVKALSGVKPMDLKTMPYPGFPTDLQAPMTTVCCVAEGTSVINETIFENRFLHTNELKRMGANIKVKDHTAIIEGGHPLTGTVVNSCDLRGGAAAVIAGLCAKGRTTVTNIHQIDRGYEHLENKLNALGADIRRT